MSSIAAYSIFFFDRYVLRSFMSIANLVRLIVFLNDRSSVTISRAFRALAYSYYGVVLGPKGPGPLGLDSPRGPPSIA